MYLCTTVGDLRESNYLLLLRAVCSKWGRFDEVVKGRREKRTHNETAAHTVVALLCIRFGLWNAHMADRGLV